MLPSRGLFRASPSLRLGKASLSTPSTRTLSRQFGTTLHNNPRTALSPRRVFRPLAVPTAARNASTQSTVPPAAPAAATPDASTLADITATPVSLTGSDLLDIPEQIGFLKTLGLDYGWGPTSLMQTILESTYVYTGLPWWASIGLVAIGIRLALLKPTVDAAENTQKLQELQKNPRYAAALEEMKKVYIDGNHLAAAEARNRIRVMNKAADYKPWKSFIQLIQLPIGIGMFRLIRGMSALPVPSFETGGILWFTDLAIPDPLYVLPIITGLIVTHSMRIPLPYMAESQQKLLKTMSLVMLPLSTVVSIFLPAGIQLYFFVTSAFHLAQTWFMHQSWFRRWVGLKPLNKSTQPAGAMTWQAPRVVDVNAPRVGGTQQQATARPETMFGSFQSTIDMAKEKLNDYSDRSAAEKAQKSAQEYEAKRALEEKEKYLARMSRKRAKDDEYF
ncbi:hypothetical protein VTK26DRAFT_6210 [Humicola hyalothermophila]